MTYMKDNDDDNDNDVDKVKPSSCRSLKGKYCSCIIII